LKTKGNYTGTINGIIGQTGTPKTPKGDEGKTLVEAIDKYCNYDPTYQDAKKTKEAEEEQKRKDKEQQDLDETIKKAEQDAKDKEAKEKEEAEKKQKDEQTKKETKEKLENDNKVSIGLTGKVLDIYVKNESLTDADKLTLTEDSTPMISGRNGLLDALKKNNKENGKRSEKDQFLNFKTFETALNTQTNEYEVKELEV
jgi:biotin carboxyl carrier protein